MSTPAAEVVFPCSAFCAGVAGVSPHAKVALFDESAGSPHALLGVDVGGGSFQAVSTFDDDDGPPQPVLAFGPEGGSPQGVMALGVEGWFHVGSALVSEGGSPQPVLRFDTGAGSFQEMPALSALLVSSGGFHEVSTPATYTGAGLALAEGGLPHAAFVLGEIEGGSSQAEAVSVLAVSDGSFHDVSTPAWKDEAALFETAGESPQLVFSGGAACASPFVLQGSSHPLATCAGSGPVLSPQPLAS